MESVELSSSSKHSDDDGIQEDDRDLLPTNISYEGLRVIGNGAFSIVYLVRVVETGELCAIKKVYQDKKY